MTRLRVRGKPMAGISGHLEQPAFCRHFHEGGDGGGFSMFPSFLPDALVRIRSHLSGGLLVLILMLTSVAAHASDKKEGGAPPSSRDASLASWPAGTTSRSEAKNWVQTQLAARLGLGPEDGFQVAREARLPNGDSLLRSAQTHAGREVAGREGSVIVASDGAVTVLGDFRPIADALPRRATIRAVDALSRAGLEALSDKESSLVYIEREDGRIRLAYEVEARFKKENKHPVRAYLDAETGGLIHSNDLVHTALQRRVFDFAGTCGQFGVRGPISDSDSAWLMGRIFSGAGAPHKAEGQLHRMSPAVEGVYDLLGRGYEYMRSIFQIDSIDDQGHPIIALADVRFMPGAYWPQCVGNEFQAFFYSGSPAHLLLPALALQAPEVVGHEMAHGIVAFGSGLRSFPGNFAPDALNESLSDMIGVGFRVWLENDGKIPAGSERNRAVWRLREPPAGVIRDMSNPAQLRQPDHYSGFRNAPGYQHYNANITNMAFYLMATGGAHPRRGGVPVEGIGMEKTLRIVGLVARILPSNANYSHTRTSLALAAEQLYGLHGAEWVAVHQAMDSVGIPGAWQRPPTPAPEPAPEPSPAPAPAPTPGAPPEPAAPEPPTSPAPAPTPEPAPPPSPPPSAPSSGSNGLLLVLMLGCIAAALWFIAKNRPKTPSGPVRSAPASEERYVEAAAAPRPVPVVASAIQLRALDGSEPLPLLPALLETREGVIIGRALGLVHVCMESRQVSRRHARVFLHGGALYVEDLGSTHGTMVDGRLLPPFQPARLEEGQLLRLAGFSYCLKTRAGK